MKSLSDKEFSPTLVTSDGLCESDELRKLNHTGLPVARYPQQLPPHNNNIAQPCQNSTIVLDVEDVPWNNMQQQMQQQQQGGGLKISLNVSFSMTPSQAGHSVATAPVPAALGAVPPIRANHMAMQQYPQPRFPFPTTNLLHGGSQYPCDFDPKMALHHDKLKHSGRTTQRQLFPSKLSKPQIQKAIQSKDETKQKKTQSKLHSEVSKQGAMPVSNLKDPPSYALIQNDNSIKIGKKQTARKVQKQVKQTKSRQLQSRVNSTKKASDVATREIRKKISQKSTALSHECPPQSKEIQCKRPPPANEKQLKLHPRSNKKDSKALRTGRKRIGEMCDSLVRLVTPESKEASKRRTVDKTTVERPATSSAKKQLFPKSTSFLQPDLPMPAKKQRIACSSAPRISRSILRCEMVKPKKSKTRVIKDVCDSLGRLPAPPVKKSKTMPTKKGQNVKHTSGRMPCKKPRSKRSPPKAVALDFLSILSPVAPKEIRADYLKNLQAKESKPAAVRVPPRSSIRMMTRSRSSLESIEGERIPSPSETSLKCMSPAVSPRAKTNCVKASKPVKLDILAKSCTKLSKLTSPIPSLLESKKKSHLKDGDTKATAIASHDKRFEPNRSAQKKPLLFPKAKSKSAKIELLRKRSKLGYKILTRKREANDPSHMIRQTEIPQSQELCIKHANGGKAKMKQVSPSKAKGYGQKSSLEIASPASKTAFVPTDEDRGSFFDSGVEALDTEQDMVIEQSETQQKASPKLKSRNTLPMCSLASLGLPTARSIKKSVSTLSKSSESPSKPADVEGKGLPCQKKLKKKFYKGRLTNPKRKEESTTTTTTTKPVKRQRRTLIQLDSMSTLTPPTMHTTRLSSPRSTTAGTDEELGAWLPDSEAWHTNPEPLGLKAAAMYAESTNVQYKMTTRFRHPEFLFPMSTKELYTTPMTRALRKHLKKNTLNDYLQDLYCSDSDDEDMSNNGTVDKAATRRHRQSDIAEYGRRIRLWELLQQD